MKYEIKVPSVGESITEAVISKWNKKSGEAVRVNDVLLLLETDKASVDVVAENEGVLTITVPEGQTVPIGQVVGLIDSEGKAATASADSTAKAPAKPAAPTVTVSSNGSSHAAPLSPSVRRLVTENQIDPASVEGTGRGGRLTKGDVLSTLEKGGGGAASTVAPTEVTTPKVAALRPATDTVGHMGNRTRRVEMTVIRRRIAERLKDAQNTAAILTTFNEIDMSAVNALRAKYKEVFNKKYGVNLGIMPIFVKAIIEALKAYPDVNAQIDGNDIIYNDQYHVGVAVSTKRGLIVPVVRDADLMSLAELELQIRDFATRGRDGKIAPDEMKGGTFTVSNGGVFGSLMSTPILNPPQSGILGMHKTEDRPVVVEGKIEIRPMMYVALSYDHRIIDGSTSVGFLVKVKEGVEDPQRLLLEV